MKNIDVNKIIITILQWGVGGVLMICGVILVCLHNYLGLSEVGLIILVTILEFIGLLSYLILTLFAFKKIERGKNGNQ